ncbi:hypothetical protein AC249_AIPGENE26446 [Exaiptasia diaphana]|nr:hypothetical protein AC249_AIPGENE26446 [Exaiptasia diaphana]
MAEFCFETQSNDKPDLLRLRDEDSNHGSILDDSWSGWEHELLAACEAAKLILQSDNIPIYEVEKEDQNGSGLSPTVNIH